MDPKLATVSRSVEQILAVTCFSSKVATRETEFHQSYISVLQREVITVYLSFLVSILKVLSKEDPPVTNSGV